LLNIGKLVWGFYAVMARRLERKKLGVQLDPPALLLLYAESGVNKKRTMPIRYKPVCSGSVTPAL
jgi:hypothetical protein